MIIFSDFFNWNRIKIRYCDGASFSGDSQNAVRVPARFQHQVPPEVIHSVM